MYGFYNFTAVGKEEKMKRINGIDPGLRRSFVPTASVCAENLFLAVLFNFESDTLFWVRLQRLVKIVNPREEVE